MTTATPATTYTIRETVYYVKSATRPGVVYTVTEAPGRYVCGCAAGQVRRACWHVKAIVAGFVKPTIRLVVTRPWSAAVHVAATGAMGEDLYL